MDEKQKNIYLTGKIAREASRSGAILNLFLKDLT